VQSWLVRAAWLALPLTVGAVVAGALDDRSTAVQLTLAALLWGCWAIVLVGLLVPRPAALVGLRAATAALLPLVAWGADSSGDWLIAGSHVLVLLALALTPTTGEWLVNGTSYGYERRYLLRVPAPLLLGPIELAAIALPAAVVTGPLLLASRQWIAGLVAIAIGAPLAVVVARAMHAMTVRWGVLVPAGFVLKDHLSMVDPVLFRRAEIELLADAEPGTDAMDLTANAIGAPLELRFAEPQHIDRLQLGRGTPTGYEVQRLLFAPTRRAALLAEAAERRIRVATPPPTTASPS
jgi:hypothetical protein